MKWDRETQFFGAAVVLIIFLISAFPVSWWWHGFRLKQQAAPMIEALESYRQRVGAYPQDSAEVGFPVIDESGPLYYQRGNSTDYIIWYGTTLGESVTYHSTDAKWR